MNPLAIVLAAGKGTRMKSELPKVLIPVLGRPMIHWVLDALETVGVTKTIVVVGYQADLVKQELAQRENLLFAEQTEQLGTGHAVQMCVPNLETLDTAKFSPTLVLAGDSPLVQTSSLTTLLKEWQNLSEQSPSCLLGTLKVDDPTGLGRIVRNNAGEFVGITEHKDATEEERQIQEVNMSTYLFHTPDLIASLSQLSNDNQQSEYYLTDCPRILLSENKYVAALDVLDPAEALSINTMEQLQVAEAKMLELGYGE